MQKLKLENSALKAEVQSLKEKLQQNEDCKLALDSNFSKEEWKAMFRNHLNVNIVSTISIYKKYLLFLIQLMQESRDENLKSYAEQIKPKIENLTE